jgi:hypothetical protein
MAIGLISDLFGVAILVFLIVYILVRILTHKH